LEQFNVQSRRVVVHTDPTGMPRNRAHWSSYNIARSADRCQMTVWCSQYNELPTSIFRSWLFEDGNRPDGLIKQRSYSVPIMDSSFVGAQKELARLQGRLGLWFAGSYVQGSNNLQSAYLSALAVVESIAAEEL
jgi:predicted NAD/FAD-binding protein